MRAFPQTLRMTQRVMEFTRANAFPIALFVILRVWTLVWASAVAAFVFPSAEATKHYYGVEPLRDAVIAPWQRWDTIWFSKIAVEGYGISDVRPAFFPLYPLLMRLTAPLTGNNVVAAGLLVSTIAALASFVLFFQLASQVYDAAAAKRALMFLVVFPTAFFLFAAYTESLFLALTLGAFLCVTNGHWKWGSVLGALAGMTRPQGAFLFLPFAVEFFAQYRKGRVKLSQVWTLAVIALGGMVHALWLTIQFGTPAAWFDAQTNWRYFAPPWSVVGAALARVLYAPSLLEAIVSAFDPFFAFVFLGALVWSWFRLPRAFTVYLAIIVLLPFFSFSLQSELFPLASFSRYVLVAFPAFFLIGKLPPGKWQLPLSAISLLLQTFWLLLFVAWVFVG